MFPSLVCAFINVTKVYQIFKLSFDTHPPPPRPHPTTPVDTLTLILTLNLNPTLHRGDGFDLVSFTPPLRKISAICLDMQMTCYITMQSIAGNTPNYPEHLHKTRFLRFPV